MLAELWHDLVGVDAAFEQRGGQRREAKLDLHPRRIGRVAPQAPTVRGRAWPQPAFDRTRGRYMFLGPQRRLPTDDAGAVGR